MTPPISIDGTDITGATIDGQDVQEITVDGQTVFTATPSGLAPSGTVLAQYRIDQNSESTVVDDTGNEFSFNVEGPSLVTDSDLIDERGLDFDGSNDRLSANQVFSFVNFDSTDEFSMMMTVEFDSVAADQVLVNIGTTTSGNDRMAFGIDRDTDGLLAFRTSYDNVSNNTASLSGLSTNTKHRVGFTNDVDSNVQVIIDKSVGTSGGDPKDTSGGTQIGARGVISHSDCTVDNVVFYDGVISSNVIEEDFDAQPFTP